MFTLTVSARAGIVYSTHGTAAPGFQPPPGYGSYAGANSTAPMFTATSSGVLSSIEVAADTVGNGTFVEDFELRQDNSGSPGTVIDSIPIDLPNSAALVTGDSTPHPS